MRKFDVGECKNQLIQKIIHSDKIVKAIDSDVEGYDPKNADTLIHRNIFPHIFIPKMQTTEQTYIMMSCDVSNINSYNPTFHNIKLTIRVMSHINKLSMKDENNTRIDYISNELISMLEDSDNFGFTRLRLDSDREIILNERYIYRELVLKTVDMAKTCR